MPPPYSTSAPGLPAALALAKFKEAVALHQSGQLEQAQVIYESIVKKFPGNYDSLHLLGHLVYQKGDHARAVELIGRAIKLNPRNAAFHYNRGMILQEMGRLDSAVAGYDRALALRPEDADAWAKRGLALQGTWAGCCRPPTAMTRRWRLRPPSPRSTPAAPMRCWPWGERRKPWPATTRPSP